jgi:hypothetical protein
VPQAFDWRSPRERKKAKVVPGVIFLGGYNIPDTGPFKSRRSVPRTMGQLVVDGTTMTLMLKRKRLGLVVEPQVLTPDDVLTVGPTLRDYLGSNAGVVIVRGDGTHLYFWTPAPGEILGLLARNGFPVTDQPIEVTMLHG